jgi:hypothetical protein
MTLHRQFNKRKPLSEAIPAASAVDVREAQETLKKPQVDIVADAHDSSPSSPESDGFKIVEAPDTDFMTNTKSKKKNNMRKRVKNTTKVNEDLEEKAPVTPEPILSTVEVGADFSAKYNIVLLIVTCIPLAATVYMGHTGSRALGPWIVVSVCHFLYVGLTYRGAPEITGCREIQVVRRDGPVIRYIGETVRRYFHGSIIKECDLDPKGKVHFHLIRFPFYLAYHSTEFYTVNCPFNWKSFRAVCARISSARNCTYNTVLAPLLQ